MQEHIFRKRLSNTENLDEIMSDAVKQAEDDESDDLLDLLDESPNHSAILRELEEILAGQTININCIRCAAALRIHCSWP